MKKVSYISVFYHLLRRDLKLGFRRPAELVNPILFFTIVIILFPLGIGPKTNLLMTMAPGVIWVAALLAALLSLESMFRSDFEDGSLEQLVLSPHPVALLVLAKVSAHWLMTGLPLVVVSPLLAVFLGMPPEGMGILVFTLLLGTPVLTLIGAIGVALIIGLRNGGIILSLLVLPLYVPVLIFATSAIDASISGFPVTAQLNIMVTFLVLAITLAPFPIAASLKISLS